MRLLSLLAFGFLVGLIILIYNMKFETRQLEERAAQLERAISEEKDNVALMRAEWSHVTRPDRIETLARDILKLEPAKPEQLITRHDFMDLLARRPIPSAADANGWKPRDEIGALIRNTGGEKNAGAGVAN
jgi:cell division protein FtsL